MNEFTAKKLGEVLAFCRAFDSTFEKGKDALSSLLNEDYSTLRNQIKSYGETIEALAISLGNEEITFTKAEKTKTKLLSMAELYIGDEWNNPAELLEWFGFFEGAAIIHWKLVLGSANALLNNELKLLADNNIEFHKKLLDRFGSLIQDYATIKAK